MRILIVEDEAIVALDLQRRLAGFNYEIAGCCADGRQALCLAEQTSPDLVLLDIGLSGPLDGIATAEQLRSRFGIPVVYLAGDADAATLERAKASAPLAYVLEPFEERNLCVTLEIAWHKYRLDRELEAETRQHHAKLGKANDALRVEITARRALERQLLAVSEREQKRFGRELHDDVGQVLTGAAFLCKALADKLKSAGSETARDAERVVEVINQALEQARCLARGLYPVELDAEGLMVALGDLASNTRKLFDIACHYEIDAPLIVHDNDVAIHLYRIAQEAVTNAVKHSGAENIFIRVTSRPSKRAITVIDDGIGIQGRGRKGMGHKLMAHRASLIGALLVIKKLEPRGTLVSVVFDPQGAREEEPSDLDTNQ